MLETLKKDLYKAQKERDSFTVSVLRFLISAVNNKEIELRVQKEELTDEHILKILKKQIKQRNQTIANYEQAGRANEATNEKKEIKLLQTYLPTDYLN